MLMGRAPTFLFSFTEIFQNCDQPVVDSLSLTHRNDTLTLAGGWEMGGPNNDIGIQKKYTCIYNNI